MRDLCGLDQTFPYPREAFTPHCFNRLCYQKNQLRECWTFDKAPRVMQKKSIIASLFLPLLLPIVKADGIKPGSCILELNIAEMAPGDKHTEYAGEIETDGNDFTFHTKKANGNEVVISGQVTENGIVMWAVSVERGHLRALHYSGKIAANPDVVAEGKVSLIQDHKRVTGRTWKLRPPVILKVPGDEPAGKKVDVEGAPSIEGIWQMTRLTAPIEEPPGFEDAPPGVAENLKISFKDGNMAFIPGEPSYTRYTYTIDPHKNPKQMDWKPVERSNKDGAAAHLIYRIEGDRITIMFDPDNPDKRPVRFDKKKCYVYEGERLVKAALKEPLPIAEQAEDPNRDDR